MRDEAPLPWQPLKACSDGLWAFVGWKIFDYSFNFRGVAEGRTRLSDFPFTFQFHALEKEMATHSSVLAWRIPGTGEPGGLRSMGSYP